MSNIGLVDKTTTDTHICSATHSSIGKGYYTQTHATYCVTALPELCKIVPEETDEVEL